MSKRRQKRPEIRVPIPAGLGTPDFVEVWEQWLEYRKQRRAVSTPLTQELQLRKCARLGPVKAAHMIERSILNGWIGLFEEAESARPQRQESVPNASAYKPAALPPSVIEQIRKANAERKAKYGY